MEKITIEQLEEFVFKKRFNTRGLSMEKKMWRDGYNKALQDFLTFINMQLQETVGSEVSDTENQLPF